MTKNEYSELQKTLAEVNVALADKTLSGELRAELQDLAAALSGQLCSLWLPMSNIRRVIMLVLFLLGLKAFGDNNDFYFVYWIATAFLSPRIVGEASYYFGRLKG